MALLAKLEGMDAFNQEVILEGLTLNNIVKHQLVTMYGPYLTMLGFNEGQVQQILASCHANIGILFDKDQGEWFSTGDDGYPFPAPLDQRIVETGYQQHGGLHQAVQGTIKEKYTQGGKALATFDWLITNFVNNNQPTYYIAVSNKLDLMRVLATVQREVLQSFKLPVFTPKRRLAPDAPEHDTHLINGTSAHSFYQYLRGNLSQRESSPSAYFRDYAVDAIVAVTPKARGWGIPVRVYRRKPPHSIAFKFAYAIASFLLYHAYTCFPTQQSPDEKDWRGKKYGRDHKRVGVQDIIGASPQYVGYEELPELFIQQGIAPYVELRHPEPIPVTGEIHYDFNLTKRVAMALLQVGRIESHGFSSPQHYIGAQLIGSHAWAPWKKSRTTEVTDMHPQQNKGKHAAELMDRIEKDVLRHYLPNIRLAGFPDEYMVGFSGCDGPEGFKGGVPHLYDMSLVNSSILGEGEHCLIRAFPGTQPQGFQFYQKGG